MSGPWIQRHLLVIESICSLQLRDFANASAWSLKTLLPWSQEEFSPLEIWLFAWSHWLQYLVCFVLLKQRLWKPHLALLGSAKGGLEGDWKGGEEVENYFLWTKDFLSASCNFLSVSCGLPGLISATLAVMISFCDSNLIQFAVSQLLYLSLIISPHSYHHQLTIIPFSEVWNPCLFL